MVKKLFTKPQQFALANWLASTDVQGRRVLAESLGAMLALDDPSFDRMRWLEACGVVIVHMKHSDIRAGGVTFPAHRKA